MASLVYIVDDDASYRISIGRLLRASGYKVMEYESASQLLANPPDGATASCIVLDVRMPGVSGPERLPPKALFGTGTRGEYLPSSQL